VEFKVVPSAAGKLDQAEPHPNRSSLPERPSRTGSWLVPVLGASALGLAIGGFVFFKFLSK